MHSTMSLRGFLSFFFEILSLTDVSLFNYPTYRSVQITGKHGSTGEKMETFVASRGCEYILCD